MFQVSFLEGNERHITKSLMVRATGGVGGQEFLSSVIVFSEKSQRNEKKAELMCHSL